MRYHRTDASTHPRLSSVNDSQAPAPALYLRGKLALTSWAGSTPLDPTHISSPNPCAPQSHVRASTSTSALQKTRTTRFHCCLLALMSVPSSLTSQQRNTPPANTSTKGQHQGKQRSCLCSMAQALFPQSCQTPSPPPPVGHLLPSAALVQSQPGSSPGQL